MSAFTRGQSIWRDSVHWEVIRFDGDEVLVEQMVSGTREKVPLAQLYDEYAQSKLQVSQEKLDELGKADPPPHAPERQRSAAGRIETARRMDYITRLERLSAFTLARKSLVIAIRDISIARKEPHPPHVSTVYRWHREFNENRRSADAIIVRFDRRGGRGVGRLSREVEAIVHEAIDEVFLKSKTCSAEAVHNAVHVRLQLLNATRVASRVLEPPSLRTVQRRLKSLYAFDLAVARFGYKEAERRFANNLGARPASKILEVVEIDHSPVDILVVDAKGVVIGRPYVTTVLDRFSRSVLGLHLSLAGHGTEAVFEALRHALLPKTYLKRKYGDLNLCWERYGWPERVLMDNGPEFHAEAVAQALIDLSIIAEYAASRDPDDKPHVERFLKTLNYSCVHGLPGTTLANVKDRIGFKSEDEACLTLEKLDRILHVWICDVYHKRPNAGLQGRTPEAMWSLGAEAHPPQLKRNVADLEITFARVAESRISNDGIDLNTFKYVSPELLNLRRMLPEMAKVSVRWPWHDAGHIWVWDSHTHQYLKVPNRNQEMAGLTVDQAKAANKALAEPGNPHREVNATAQETIRGMVNQALADRKLKGRRKGARLDNQTSKPLRDSDAAQPPASTPAPAAEPAPQPTPASEDNQPATGRAVTPFKFNVTDEEEL